MPAAWCFGGDDQASGLFWSEESPNGCYHRYEDRSMEVTLKPEFEKLIQEEIRSGRTADPNEFLNQAVYHYLLARDLGQQFTPEEMDRLIAEGLDDIERGDILDGSEAFRQLRAYSAKRRRLHR
jgi:antitoxin ParD1/3/4